jgi:hypothetical protein
MPVPALRDRFEHALPGHPVAATVRIRRGTFYVRTHDKYMFIFTAEGMSEEEAIDAFIGILASGKPLGEGYFPAVRMRQEIHGRWRDARRFGMDTWFYYLAPVDTVRLEFTAFPLRVTYYADHVDLRPTSSDEAAALRVRLAQGFNEVPPAMRDVDGVILEPGRPWRFSFLYSQFVPFNADIDLRVQLPPGRLGLLPYGEIHGGTDLFCMFGPPASCPPGSELFGKITRRSVILDRVLGLQGETFPANDERFPEWAEEDYDRRFPHRRSKK